MCASPGSSVECERPCSTSARRSSTGRTQLHLGSGLDPEQSSQPVRGPVQHGDRWREDALENARAAQTANARRFPDARSRTDFGASSPNHDVKHRDDRERDRHGNRRRRALAQTTRRTSLNQVPERRLAGETKADRSHRDAQLTGRQVRVDLRHRGQCRARARASRRRLPRPGCSSRDALARTSENSAATKKPLISTRRKRPAAGGRSCRGPPASGAMWAGYFEEARLRGRP